MRLPHAEEARVDRQVIGEVQVRCRDAAGQRASQRRLQSAGAKGKHRLRVREEESRGDLVLAAAKFAIVVGRELVVGIFSGTAGDKWSGVQAYEASVRINADPWCAGQ